MEPTLKREALERIAATDPIGGDAFVERLVLMFLDSIGRRMERLDQSLLNHRVPELIQAAHAFKSAAASVGALRIAAVCKDLEMDARAGQTTRAATLIAELKNEISSGEAQLREFVRN